MGQPVDGKSGCHFVPTCRFKCTIIVCKSVYLYRTKSKKKTNVYNANTPLFFFLLLQLLALRSSDFDWSSCLRQVSQCDGSFCFAIFLAAAKIHNMPTHTQTFTICINARIYTHTYTIAIHRLLLIKLTFFEYIFTVYCCSCCCCCWYCSTLITAFAAVLPGQLFSRQIWLFPTAMYF